MSEVEANAIISRQYALHVSLQDFDPRHNYTSEKPYPLHSHGPEFKDLEEAVTYASSISPTNAKKDWVAYWVSETVTSTTVNKDENGGLISLVETRYTEKAHIVYRSFTEYYREVISKRIAYQKYRVDSGEVALQEALKAEHEENILRWSRGEKPVYEAERAWRIFTHDEIPKWAQEEKTGFFAKLKRALFVD